jgi:hypothetical protein
MPCSSRPRVADAVPVRRQRSASSFHTDSASGYSGQSQPERPRECDHDLAVAAGVARAGHGAAHAVDPALGVRERAVLLAKLDAGDDSRRCRVDVSFRKQVLGDEELELARPSSTWCAFGSV